MKVGKMFFEPLEKCDIEQIGTETSVDVYSKKLKLEEHIKLLVGMILHQFGSLGDLAANADRHTELIKISKSQLSKVNNTRNYAAFVYAFYKLLKHPSNYRRFWRMRYFLEKKIIGIDSTTIKVGTPLKVSDEESPLTEKESKGIKIHLGALLGTLVQPISGIVTPDNVNDGTEFENLLRDIASVERLEDIILVFDKGYTNYKRYNSFIIRGILFVAPLKKNAKFEVLSSIDYKNYTAQMILLDGMKLRLVIYKDVDGKVWRFITNIPLETLTGDDIREIYRMRWMIEIFFRELKGFAKIEHLFSKSINGVMIQIYSTLIAVTLINIFMIKFNILESVSKGAELVRHGFDHPIEIFLDG